MHVVARLAVAASLMCAAVGAADADPGPVAGLTPEGAAALVADGGRAMSKEEIMATTRLGQSGPMPSEASILTLPDLKELTPGAAAALARYRGAMLALDGLEELTAETAAVLADFASEDDVLDLGEDVSHLHPWFGFLSLGGLRTISPEAAAALAGCEMNLLLDGLTTLTPEVAAALAAHRGVLSLESVRTIPDAVAKALAKHRGEHLVLDGVTTLSPKAAAALADYEGARLSLSGLAELSVEAARALAAYEGVLRLQGLTSLSPEVAEALAGSRGRRLSLSGMTTLPAETAVALAEYQGGMLLLNGLVEISDEAAKALSGCAARLDLANLTTLSDAARESLMGRIKDAPQGIFVICIPRVTAEMMPLVKAVAARQGEAVLGNVAALDGDDAEEVARLLAGVDGRVGLPRLRRVSAAALDTLRADPDIVLPPPESLTVVPGAAGTGGASPEPP